MRAVCNGRRKGTSEPITRHIHVNDFVVAITSNTIPVANMHHVIHLKRPKKKKKKKKI